MSVKPDNGGLMLKSVRETCQRLWNNSWISAAEKRMAKAFYDDHCDDMHQLNKLNRRMGHLITERTPLHQR